MKLGVLLVLLGLVALVLGDCYMQHPRGTNDRNNEANTDRDNANRLFDSQNNAQGGYCAGPTMTYYAGSNLYVQWMNQHGCGGNPNLYCNFVLQYMCGNNDPTDLNNYIRDGSTTDTITADATGPTTLDANGDPLYGMHENYVYWNACNTREANMGLFIADRGSQGGLVTGQYSASTTRQNNNGERFGYECQEERDYYPYWSPTPWKDIAIFTASTSYCSFYQSHSENVMGRGSCVGGNPMQSNGLYANNPSDCTANGGSWQVSPSHGLPPPDCLTIAQNHDNHIGMNEEGDFNNYNWVLPTTESCLNFANGCNCVLRIRYNISAGDLGANGNNPVSGFIDFHSNAGNSPVQDDEYITQDGNSMQLAMDTTQFGRTFQDRSYMFHLVKRPSNLENVKIWNLNVKGKRGNIVEVYPANEYDFAPINSYVLVGDFIHFQWTGCDTNPAGNAGEGTDQTDRSNIVQISDRSLNIPVTDAWIKQNPNLVLFPDTATRVNMAYLGQTNCKTYAELAQQDANDENTIQQDPENCMKLNVAGPYFNGGAVHMTTAGSYHFISTRNNNFTNRSHKGSIFVQTALPIWGIVLVVFGSAVMISAVGVGIATWYARSHPHSGIATFLSRFN